MARKTTPLVNGEIYHIIVRGIDGQNIFRDKSDYYRAIHDLFEFNDEESTIWQFRRSFTSNNQFGDGPRTIAKNEGEKKKRKFLLEILCFCLMPNHIHLLLRQLKNEGISRFMRKFGTGYVGYFNKKYNRQGYLFQSRFKRILIKDDEQLRKIFVYIHTNPAALVDSFWKEGGIKKSEMVIDFIENYKWSSYSDYLGKKNFPSVTNRDLFNSMMTSTEWKKFVDEWVNFKTEDFNWYDPDFE